MADTDQNTQKDKNETQNNDSVNPEGVNDGADTGDDETNNYGGTMGRTFVDRSFPTGLG